MPTGAPDAAADSARELPLEAFRPRPAVALHHQIKEHLYLQLRSERWPPGYALPSEEALCDHYGVSRGTLRRAIADLVSEGYVERYRGRGTFVSQPKLESGVVGSYSRFRVVGPPLDAGGRVLFCRRTRAARDVAAMLNVKPGTGVWNLERVRFTQTVPVSLQTSFLPFDLCPGLARQDLAHEHLIDVLRDVYGVHLGSAVEYIDPTVADGYAARHLGLRVRTPLFQIERTTYTVTGVVAEYRRAVLRGDVYRYRIELR
jgi:GntR family transcriptional regulator